MSRVALICTECLEITWVDREGVVLEALKGSRRFHLCPLCE